MFKKWLLQHFLWLLEDAPKKKRCLGVGNTIASIPET